MLTFISFAAGVIYVKLDLLRLAATPSNCIVVGIVDHLWRYDYYACFLA